MLTAEAQKRREEMTPKLSKSSKLLNLHRFHYFWRTINHY